MIRRETKLLPGLAEEKILDVTCGTLTGKLHRELFTCPGIHRECIELENGDFVTPKKFMYMGEKARLKDWKNAVRINGIQVRKHIDAGQLTFYNHDSMCTGRCQARSPSIKPEQLYASPAPTSYPSHVTYMTTTAENGIMQIQSVQGGKEVDWNQNGYGDDDSEDVKPDVQQLQLQMLGRMNQSPRTSPSTATMATTSNQSAMSYPDVCGETTDEEDRLLWKGIVELGLVDEFFREIKASLDILKNKMIRRMVPLEDTKKISIIVKELGLMTKLKYKLEAHQTDMERQRIKLDREMEELQRKVKEYEQKKEVLKRKSECFNQLLDMAKKEADSVQESKRFRHGSGSPVDQYLGQSNTNNIDSDMVDGSMEDEDRDAEKHPHKVIIVRKNHGDGDKNIRLEFEQIVDEPHGDECSSVVENDKSDFQNADETESASYSNSSKSSSDLTKLKKIKTSSQSIKSDPE